MKLHIKKIIMPVIQLRIDWKIKIYIITTVVGAIIGLLILFPLNQVGKYSVNPFFFNLNKLCGVF